MSRAAFYVLFTASGFAGLIYESLWTHYLKLFLGHAAYAQSLVLVAFMGGMAAGAAWCGRRSTRIRHPLAAYALVESLVGLAALAFHSVFVFVTDWSHGVLLPALGVDALALAAKLAVSALLILAQSFLLGMTFPLMSAGLARAHPGAAGESVAMLYFANSLGAAAGVLASGFVLIAWAGLPGTLRIAAGLNLAIAATVWLMAPPGQHAPLVSRMVENRTSRLILGVAFFTGLASFIYEIVWIRMLSLVLGASTNAFELMLATFILGLALGGLAVRRQADAAEPSRLLAGVQIAMALAALATPPVYDQTFALMETLMTGLARSDTGYLFFNLSGAAIAGLVMLPATFCAGMTLPLLTGALLRAGSGEAAIGRVYAANTLGAIAGVVLAVQAGLPLLGLKGTLIFGCVVDAGLGIFLLNKYYLKKQVALTAAVCATVFVVVGLLADLDANKMTAGVFRYGTVSASRDAEILFNKDGKTATVHLVKYAEAVSLRTNGKSDGSINMDLEGGGGTDEVTMGLTGGLPLSLRPGARTAAVIRAGAGPRTPTRRQSPPVPRGFGAERAGRGVSALRGVRAERSRPADRGERRAAAAAGAGAGVRGSRPGEGALDGARADRRGPRRALPRQPRDARAAGGELRRAGQLRLRAAARPQRGAPPLHGEERRRGRRPAQRRPAAARDARAGPQPAGDQRAVRRRLRLRSRREHAIEGVGAGED